MTESPIRYLPAIICAEYDSPIDALLGLHIPLDEAMDLVAAHWHGGAVGCVLASADGGRAVAAILLPSGRWAACNAFVTHLCDRRSEAERQLRKLAKRGRRGCVGELRGAVLLALEAESSGVRLVEVP